MANDNLMSIYQRNCVNVVQELDSLINSLAVSELQIDKDFTLVAKMYKNTIINLWNNLVNSKDNTTMVRKLYKAIDATYHVYLRDKKRYECRKTEYLETCNEDLNNYESDGLMRYRNKK